MKMNSLKGLDFNQIMMQQTQKSIDEPAYCRYCGKDIKTSYTSAEERPWELRYSAHTKCHQSHVYNNRGNQR